MTKIRVTAPRQSLSWMPGSGWFTGSEAGRTSSREPEEQEELGTPHPVGPARGLHQDFRARQRYGCLYLIFEFYILGTTSICYWTNPALLLTAGVKDLKGVLGPELSRASGRGALV